MVENNPSSRLNLIDFIRSCVILEMIAYHFLWDLVYLFDVDIPWYHSKGAYIWQQSICWIFIMLAGFSWNLGKHHLKRGLLAVGCGGAISIITRILMPNDAIRYGILTLLGSCILLWIILDKILNRVPGAIGLVVSFSAFTALKILMKKNIIDITVNSDNDLLNHGLAYIGFPQMGFSSTDYFPLLPWMLLFATGYFLSKLIKSNDRIYSFCKAGRVPVMNDMGRHSLIIYMIHQPTCYVIAMLCVKVINNF